MVLQVSCWVWKIYSWLRLSMQEFWGTLLDVKETHTHTHKGSERGSRKSGAIVFLNCRLWASRTKRLKNTYITTIMDLTIWNHSSLTSWAVVWPSIDRGQCLEVWNQTSAEEDTGKHGVAYHIVIVVVFTRFFIFKGCGWQWHEQTLRIMLQTHQGQ